MDVKRKAEELREKVDGRVEVSIESKDGGVHGLIDYIVLRFPKEPYKPMTLYSLNEVNRLLMILNDS